MSAAVAAVGGESGWCRRCSRWLRIVEGGNRNEVRRKGAGESCEPATREAKPKGR